MLYICCMYSLMPIGVFLGCMQILCVTHYSILVLVLSSSWDYWFFVHNVINFKMCNVVHVEEGSIMGVGVVVPIFV